MPAANRSTPLALFALFSWVHMLFQTLPFLRAALGTGADTPFVFTLFHLLAWSSYSLVYLLPALLIVALVRKFLPGRPSAVAIFAVLLTTLTLIFIRIDRTIYDLYNFHFNAFVLNLLLTPGGIESLGSGAGSYWSGAMIGLGLLLTQTVLYGASVRLAKRLPTPWLPRALAALLLALMLGDKFIYGLSDLRNLGAVLDTANSYPFYKYTRFRGLAQTLGVQVSKREHVLNAQVDDSRLSYPLAPMRYTAGQRPLNIVWLVAESLRWDRLSADIMPNTWAFARNAQYFTHHYSSGNGTREGMFGMFYGLYGSYWSNFLHAGQGPLLMDRVMALNYQLDLRTSARFTYPEFDKTIFARVPRGYLHEDQFTGEAWQRDRDNTSALLDFIKHADRQRPFLSFLFFESTHARYTFPEEAVIRRPYLEDLDYADMSREKLAQYADQLLNRYTNAAHWVDMQLGRIYQQLQQQGLLDNTIVIVTGDHGEEFMEKGFWGHNSSFVEEQVRTPLVMWMPGRIPAVIDRPTNHVDIAVTLLQMLGAANPTGDYALGRNLFDDGERGVIVSSDWHSIGVMAKDLKYRIPYNNRGLENYQPTDRGDKVYPKALAQQMLDRHRSDILEAIRNSSRFAR